MINVELGDYDLGVRDFFEVNTREEMLEKANAFAEEHCGETGVWIKEDEGWLMLGDGSAYDEEEMEGTNETEDGYIIGVFKEV